MVLCKTQGVLTDSGRPPGGYNFPSLEYTPGICSQNGG